MKLTSAFVTLAAMASVQALTPCSSNANRKELRSLSSAEWSRVSAVLTQMQNYGWFQWYSYLHTNYFNVIHNCEMFFPFHRRFIRDFETTGQRFDPTFVLPYWDEVRDYANPAASAVLSAAYTGTNGQGSNSCVQNGLQRGWNMAYPNTHCLKRQYNNGNTINPMYSPEYIQSLLSRSTTMSQLRPAIEYSQHGIIHLSLGGDMVQTYSPNDFAFWLHHANIDRLWFVWQLQNPQQNFWSLDGKDGNGNTIGYGTPITYYGDAIIDVMYPTQNSMCFTYDNMSTVSSNRKRSVVTKRDGKKCIPRPSANNNYGSLPALVEGIFEDVNEVHTDAQTFVRDTLVQNLPSDLLNKWFPTLANGSTANYTAADIPKPPVVLGTDSNAIPSYTGYVAPSIPSAASALAGYDDGSNYSYATETPSSYSASSIPVTSVTYDTTDVATGSTDEEGMSSGGSVYVQPSEYATSTSINSAVVPIPTHASGDDSGPDGYSVTYHIFDFGDSNGLDGTGPKYPMPNPSPFSYGFIKMHGYSVNEITQHYNMALEFVGDMNGAGYQSPYAYGAKNFTSSSAN